jgi:AGCS family alanine or glycine:cation symporter
MKNYLLSLITFLIPFLNFAQETSEKGLDQQIDEAFKPFSDLISSIIFFEVFDGAPFVIILLVGSALFFSIYFGFPNFRYF